MVIHNATFMVELSAEGAAIAWLRDRIPELGPLRQPRLSAMREAGGIDCAHAEAQSLAFQCEFDSVEEALAWREQLLAPVADRFMTEFGPNALLFTSIFQLITIPKEITEAEL